MRLSLLSGRLKQANEFENKLKEQLVTMVEQNDERAAHVFKSWLQVDSPIATTEMR